MTLNLDITTPIARGRYHPNFIDEKVEFQRGEVTCQREQQKLWMVLYAPEPFLKGWLHVMVNSKGPHQLVEWEGGEENGL